LVNLASVAKLAITTSAVNLDNNLAEMANVTNVDNLALTTIATKLAITTGAANSDNLATMANATNVVKLPTATSATNLDNVTTTTNVTTTNASAHNGVPYVKDHATAMGKTASAITTTISLRYLARVQTANSNSPS
jgi:hypothetical protein